MTVYLIHFDQPYKHARHYLGYAHDLDERLERHRHGSGSRLLQVIHDAGIQWQLAESWEGDRSLERKLKNMKHAPRFCPICQAERIREKRKGKMDDSDFWFVITQWGYSGEDDRRYRVARFVATEHGQELEKGGILYKKSWAAQAAADHLNEIPVVVGEADENSSDC